MNLLHYILCDDRHIKFKPGIANALRDMFIATEGVHSGLYSITEQDSIIEIVDRHRHQPFDYESIPMECIIKHYDDCIVFCDIGVSWEKGIDEFYRIPYEYFGCSPSIVDFIEIIS